jgi:hypothetical protein
MGSPASQAGSAGSMAVIPFNREVSGPTEVLLVAIDKRRCPVAAPPRLRRRGSGRRVAVSLIWVVQRQQQPWESLCLNAYLMNRWSRSSIRVCLAGVASTDAAPR